MDVGKWVLIAICARLDYPVLLVASGSMSASSFSQLDVEIPKLIELQGVLCYSS